MNRLALLTHLAQAIRDHPARVAQQTLKAAIDGIDGAGKTHFADELAYILSELGVPVIRAGVDGFHHPRAHRYQRGRDSAEGFYRDSYDYDTLRHLLLDPLAPGGNGSYCAAAFDVVADQPLTLPNRQASRESVLVLDGLFLHRPELRNEWDVSVFLRVPFETSIPRGASRGEGYGSPDPEAASNARYIGGQLLYFADAQPEWHATFVIDNTDLSAPLLIRPA